jgi:phosphatidylethanolamine/phosphatidyl-N-methylethanolamine N-methyltransferase
VDYNEQTPPYVHYLARLIRPFPNFDFFFIKSLRQAAVDALRLQPGNRVLDVGCGPGGTFPYLVEAVGSSGEVVGIEISPAVAINARNRIEVRRWSNVQVIQGDARTVTLSGEFDGLVLFAAPDVYASPQALANLLPYLKDNAPVVAFGAKLSRRRFAGALNMVFRSLMKLSFSSTPGLNHEPWSVLENWLVEVHVQEYFFGCMFLASGVKKPMGRN